MNLLLDAASFLWLCSGSKQLSAAAAAALSDADNTVNLSAVTAWEISLKAAKGKLKLPAPIETWFPAMIRHHQLLLWPVEAVTAIASTRLPALHTDPFDRFLVALAQERGFTLVTPDAVIPQYPNLNIIW